MQSSTGGLADPRDPVAAASILFKWVGRLLNFLFRKPRFVQAMTYEKLLP